MIKIKQNRVKIKNLMLFIIYSTLQLLYCIFLNNKVYPVYGINDDVIIKSWISGDYSGYPEFFIRGQATPRVLFGYIVSFLYKFFPHYEWFSLILLASVMASWSFVFIVINNISKGKIRIYANLTVVLFYFTFFSAYFITPTYTAAAFLPTSSGLMLLINFINNKKLNFKFILLISLWLFWGFSIRSESAIFSIICFSVIIFYLVLKNKSQIKNILLLCLIFFSLVTTGEVIENNIYNSNSNWLNYKHFESLRYQIQDNQIERNLVNNLAESGWTKSEYLIFDEYLYADPIVFTSDKFKQTIDTNIKKSNLNLPKLIRESGENSRIPLFPWSGVVTSIIVFGISSLFLRPSKFWTSIALRFIFLIPTILSFIYISVMLRLPERVLISTLYLIFIVLLVAVIIEDKIYSVKENSLTISGYILAILGLIIIFPQLEGTNQWLIDRHKNSFYRDFWQYQKLVIQKLPENSILIGNQSQIKSDWSNPYLRQDVDSNFKVLTLGWHTFSPHWENRKKNLGIEKVNLLRALPSDKRLIWIGNDSTIKNLSFYINEKLGVEVMPRTIDTLKIGEFEYQIFTLYLP